MFFIIGSGEKKRKLDFDQMIVCSRCGRYGHLEVYMVYSYISLFFIPLIQWGKQYYVKTTCCGASASLEKETGNRIRRGELLTLPESIIPGAVHQFLGKKRCQNCGFETEENFQFCPKCGGEF